MKCVYPQEISPEGQVVFEDLPEGTTSLEISLPDGVNVAFNLEVKVCTEGRKMRP